MRGATSIAAVVAALSVGVPTLDPSAPCEATFDATFVQLTHEQGRFDAARWGEELRLLQRLGIELVIVQFTGDERGPYDRGSERPVAELLRAAEAAGIEVYLGLHHEPRGAPTDIAVPLQDRPAARALGQLCTSTSACAGWYISRELDDTTWATPARTHALRAYLAHTSAALRELAPGRRIAIAPYFTTALSPEAYARWWRALLDPGVIDVVLLQDGVGTGRATPGTTAEYLAHLGPALREIDVELWSVAELFQQTHGVPIDARPFAAVPMHPATLRHSLAIQRPLVTRAVAFAVLDYMDPRRGGLARQLHDDYAARCRAARNWRPSC